MLQIDDKILLNRAGNTESYFKGLQYYRMGRVTNVKYIRKLNYVEAIVKGSEDYKVYAEFSEKGKLISTHCTCPAYEKYPGDCKHIVALLTFIEKSELKNILGELSNTNIEKEKIKDIINYYRYNNERETLPLNIEYNYEYKYNKYDGIDNSSFLSLRIGEDKLYVVKNIRKFFESLENNEEIQYGKGFTFYPSKHVFKDEDKEIMNFLRLLYENHKMDYGETIFKDKRIQLTPESLKRFFEMMKSRSFNATIMDEKYEDINIVEENLPLDMFLRAENEEMVVEMNFDYSLRPLTKSGDYFFYKGKIYNPSVEQARKLGPIYNIIMSDYDGVMKIPEECREAFISEVIPNIKNIVNIHIDEKVQNAIYNPEFKGEIYFDKEGDMVVCKVNFIYGDISINPFSSKADDKGENKKILLRDIEKERSILKQLEESSFKVRDGEIYIDDEEKIYALIYETIPKLQELCDIYYSENFKNIIFRDSSYFSGGIRLNDNLDMLEFDFEIDGIEQGELIDVFKSMKEKKKYYRLKDGSFLPLDNEELKYMKEVFDYLNINKKDLEAETIVIPKYRAIYIDDFLKEKQLDFIKKNAGFKKLVHDINEVEDMEYEVPEELENTLREYQKFGFKWLKTLSNCGLGGILADDMGLGKTLQMIAFLLSEKIEKGQNTSIVIAPTSVIYNWEAEIDKFAPDLKTLVVSGSKVERISMLKDIQEYDVVITSYPLIRKDIEEYEKYSFRTCILDEAQHIKNPNSISAKSVKRLKAKNYFALTGTPMENSLLELWSIFDYIMPGYLMSHGKFVDKYEKPIIANKDEKVLKDLNNHIRPFILRRLKKDVLKELPEKIEQKILVDLTKEQKKVYLAYLKAIKGEIEEEINTSGFAKNQIKILSGLTRLRQICCHPGMFIENYEFGSGKLDSLEEILYDALDGEHRILIFSQFTSMLNIIKERLKRDSIEYMYLDGSTDVKERGKLVEEFNGGKGQVFLISLKAGGTGLNLTGADMVIHFDPWWNPAVEDQATDRAYRIGQKNTVQVLKLITKGTIEEKIFELQEAKKEMIDKVITEGETLVSKLSEEEIKYLFDM
ncbi:MAG: Superfamily II DNA or RNA helicase, SNF2 family [Sporanaerobacter sp.]|jgi:SNF2 family DNA or RNA helicase|uniref:SNF2 helicase associated domain-containing protein n=1 Tax=Sporanaerobacter sp. TaxID=2010183 RepID=UPI003A102897